MSIWPYLTYRRVSTGTDAVVIATGEGFLDAYYVSNDNDIAFRYVHLYDLASAPGSLTGCILTLAMPPDSGANQEYSNGITFSNGLAMAFSTLPGSLSAVAASEVVANIFYEEF